MNVICAETKEEAEQLAKSNQIWKWMQDKGKGNGKIPSITEVNEYKLTDEDLELLRKSGDRQIVGTPDIVRKSLELLSEEYGTDEFMILTITHDFAARKKSYELIAREFGL